MTAPARILLTHPQSALELYYGPRALAGLQALGDVRTTGSTPGRGADHELAPDALIALAQDCDIVVSFRGTAAPAALFERLPRLVAFLRCAVDVRNIDLAAASAHGVLVTQASAGFSAAVAEWTLGAMVDLARGITASTLAYRRGEAETPRLGRELRGSTLGLIGHGRIARHLIPIAKALGMRVVVHDPHAAPDGDAAIERLGFDDLLAGADFVVCLATATEETENLIDARALARMKPGAYFINPSRGNLVDEAALQAALDVGALAGCALDVGRAPDQMPTPALARHPKVIATPHVGGLTRPAIEHQSLETVAQVREILQGRAPTGSLNAEAAARLAQASFRSSAAPLPR